jgi:hypothetical protein
MEERVGVAYLLLVWFHGDVLKIEGSCGRKLEFYFGVKALADLRMTKLLYWL